MTTKDHQCWQVGCGVQGSEKERGKYGKRERERERAQHGAVVCVEPSGCSVALFFLDGLTGSDTCFKNAADRI